MDREQRTELRRIRREIVTGTAWLIANISEEKTTQQNLMISEAARMFTAGIRLLNQFEHLLGDDYQDLTGFGRRTV